MGDVPAGLYEHLITGGLRERLAATEPELLQLGVLDPADSHETLTRHIAELSSRALRIAGGSDAAGVSRQVELTNRIVAAISELAADAVAAHDVVVEPPRTLLALAQPSPVPGPVSFPDRPATPLSTSALLVNGRGQPRIGYEVTRELASADDVDLLCAFIKWQGLRVLEKALLGLRERGGRLRVITTTYMGATDQRALDRLVERAPKSRSPTRRGRPGCMPRPGSSAGPPECPRPTSAPRICHAQR